MKSDLPPDSTDRTPPGPPDGYFTLADQAVAEIRVQRSRFLASCARATDLEGAAAFISGVARRHHGARHVCWAWRIGSPPEIIENRNDDGEPSGTAGEPILSEIRKADLTETVVVVVRYFGGVKLGTGGLARAYGQAAADALAGAPRQTIRLGRHFKIRFPYAFQKTITRLLERAGGEVVADAYAADVTWRVWLPHSRRRRFVAAVREASAGRVAVDPVD